MCGDGRSREEPGWGKTKEQAQVNKRFYEHRSPFTQSEQKLLRKNGTGKKTFSNNRKS
ncbi:hypothetical protein CTL2C_167 [Chlamydia trachomatis L2c]|nr:hypothetical protein CTL2C_167 [Chlamydia trachomatis L2c]